MVRRENTNASKERAARERERQAHEAYLKKMEEEAERKREAESMIARLEREERDLINRLKKTQELQEKASYVFGVLFFFIGLLLSKS